MKKKILLLAIIFLIIVLLAGCVSHPSKEPPTPTPNPTLSQGAITSAIPLSTPVTTIVQTQTTVAPTSPTPTQISPAQPSGTMTVHFLDVGQGDSILIQAPSGKYMLIDAGTTNAGSTVSNYLKNLGITTLDIVIATHPHADHIGGMATVLNNFKVNQFIDSVYPHTTSMYENMLNSIDKKNIPFQTVKTGDIIVFDPAISISVLNPQDSFMNDINANSVVLKLTYGKTSFLFMGDAATDVEDRIAGAALNVDILKVAHHGSSSSSGSAFLAKVTPAVSIIEVGAGNSYGYPAAATLSRLQQIGSKVYRTDLDGTIKVTSDGNSYNVITTAG